MAVSMVESFDELAFAVVKVASAIGAFGALNRFLFISNFLIKLLGRRRGWRTILRPRSADANRIVWPEIHHRAWLSRNSWSIFSEVQPLSVLRQKNTSSDRSLTSQICGSNSRPSYSFDIRNCCEVRLFFAPRNAA